MPIPVYDVCALGNAIVDIVADVSEDFLRQHRITKDGMMLVDLPHMTSLRRSLTGARAIRAGGAAGNMVAGFASFGGKAAYMGKIAYDEVGHIYSDDLQKLGVHFLTLPLTRSGAATGLCLSLVTPGAHRSMCTYLGASVEFSAEDVDPAIIQSAQIIYLEGYMFDRPGTRLALQRAAEVAQAAGRKVALALCNPGCVERNRTDFLELVNSKVNILFATEKELLTLYKTFNIESALHEVTAHVNTVVVTRGEKGALIVNAARHLSIPAEPVVPRVVDKAGAGDLFAAGFLFGYAHQFDITSCARMGAIAAAEVISHYGPRPEQSLAALAKQKGVLL